MATIPTFIDIEASGFGRGSYPIEVGVAMPDRATHCYIIRPETDWTQWDKSAEALHGLSRELLLERGRSVQEVARQLNRQLSGQRVYSDAWSYDLSWLGKLFDRAGVPQLFRLEGLRSLLSEAEAESWHPVKRQVIEQTGLTRHRASADARILQQTLLQIRADSVCST